MSVAAAGGKKKRQRRKQTPVGPPAAKVEVAPMPPVAKEPVIPVAKEVVAEEEDVVEEVTMDKAMIADVANFKFEPDNAITEGTYS